MALNANSGGRRTLANDQEKWMFGFDRVRVLVCTIAVSFFFSRWPPYWKAFETNFDYFVLLLKGGIYNGIF